MKRWLIRIFEASNQKNSNAILNKSSFLINSFDYM